MFGRLNRYNLIGGELPVDQDEQSQSSAGESSSAASSSANETESGIIASRASSPFRDLANEDHNVNDQGCCTMSGGGNDFELRLPELGDLHQASGTDSDRASSTTDYHSVRSNAESDVSEFIVEPKSFNQTYLII